MNLALLAHTAPPTPQLLWWAWQWTPGVLLTLGLTLGLYLIGVLTLWRRVGWGRGVHYGQVAAFCGGIVTLFIALVSPLDALSAALFSAHMVQHLLLLLVAPLLLVWSRPLAALLWALPHPLRIGWGRWSHRSFCRMSWGLLTLAPVAWCLHSVAIWLWHAPALYQAAVRDEWLHLLEHGAFLGTALLFWWTVIYPHGGRRAYGGSLLSLFLMGLQGGVLGALLLFSAAPWYPVYAPLTARWGLTPLADQQLAGLIMWIPAGVLYLLVAAWLFLAWWAAVERHADETSLLPRSTAVVRKRGLAGEVSLGGGKTW